MFRARLASLFDLLLFKGWPFSRLLFLLVFPANNNLTRDGPTAGYYSVFAIVSLCKVSRSAALTLARVLALLTRILGAYHFEFRSGH